VDRQVRPVQVQFHWDRDGKEDEKSSCWLQVSQGMGRRGVGTCVPPHLGQEVIVEFLEGDPDRPIITGRIYNVENMPSLKLPASS